MKDLSRFLRPYRLWAILAPLFMALEVALDLAQPVLLRRIVDEGIARSDLPLVLRTRALMLALAVLGVGAGAGCTVFAVLAAQGFGADVRRALFGRVQEFSFGNLDALDGGSLITRLGSDVTQVQEAVMMILRVMVRVPLLLIGSLLMAIVTSPRLSLLFLPLIPFVAAVLLVIIRKTYPLFGRVQSGIDALNTVLGENLSGVRVVKAFAREDHEARRFARENAGLTGNNVAAARWGVATMPLMMLALNAGVVAALWLGGSRVIAGGFEVGRLIAFVNYLSQTLMSLMMVSMLIVRLSRAEASSRRIGEVLRATPQIAAVENGFAPPASTWEGAQGARVEFENVSFSYGDDSEPVLQDISFTVEPGQTLAILGATGSGKSTLAQLIPRFYDVTAGRVLLDGVDVREWDEDALHRAVGIALQESVLFSGTIRDNIRYGQPDATDEQVLSAARDAQADEFIQGFPDGYDSAVGARGLNLSGGQKQRLAIARALLIHPQVLVLDDSTSAVDVHTEARIQAALARSHRGQTRVIVAQRISAVKNADIILVLDDGRMAARGTHEELLRSSAIYREIHESQAEIGVMADAAAQ